MKTEFPTPMHVGAERRQWIRHPCDLTAFCRKIGTLADVAPWRSTVVDLCAGGSSRVTGRLMGPGVSLSVELQARPPKLTYRPRVQVIRSNKTEPGWELGCFFVSSFGKSKLRQLLFPPLGSRETHLD